MDEKQRLYGERYPIDEDFLAALAIMPEASGMALGFDRLVMLATGAQPHRSGRLGAGGGIEHCSGGLHPGLPVGDEPFELRRGERLAKRRSPEALSHSSSVAMRACSSVSTPSAITSMPSEWPMSTMEAMSRRCASDSRTGMTQLPVDLEPAWLQLQQAHDRGIAGAEIVDLDVDAELAQLVDVEGDDVVALVEVDGFDQFERDRARFDVELLAGS